MFLHIKQPNSSGSHYCTASNLASDAFGIFGSTLIQYVEQVSLHTHAPQILIIRCYIHFVMKQKISREKAWDEGFRRVAKSHLALLHTVPAVAVTVVTVSVFVLIRIHVGVLHFFRVCDSITLRCFVV
jgi:hypothetical protein